MKKAARFKYLVTGATGFVGKRLISALIAEGGPSCVTAMVHRSLRPSERHFLDELRKQNVSTIECDLLELPSLNLPVPSFDVIYHLAAYVETERESDEISVNIEGTRNLILWLDSALAGKHFIYTGTLASVDRERLAWGPMTEETPCYPRTQYGRTKLAAERLIIEHSKTMRFDATILRLCTIIGPGFRAGGMFDVFPQLLQRKALGVRLNWPGRTSLLCISDLVRILTAIPHNPQTRNEMFVLSNGENPTFDQLLDEIALAIGLERQRIVVPSWIWTVIGSIAMFGADTFWVPHRLRTFCWRISLMVCDGICANSSKLNHLVGESYSPIREALQDAYS